MSLKKLGAAFGLILLIVVAAPSSVAAATIGFTCLTDNGGPAEPCSSFAGTFTGTVTATATGFTATITNGGAGDGVITMVAVDAPGSGTGYSLTGLIESPDASVNFEIDDPAANLGAGFTSEFSATALPPPTTNGANAGESIGLVFTLTTPLSQSDLDALINSGGLLFGLHVQSLGTQGQSEKLISGGGPGTPIPEPATMLLLGSGLLIAARARRRKTT